MATSALADQPPLHPPDDTISSTDFIAIGSILQE